MEISLDGHRKDLVKYISKFFGVINMSPSVLSPDYRLTQEQLKSFHEDGFIGPFQVCTPEKMSEIRSKIESEVLNTPSDLYGFDTGRDRHLDRQVIYDLITHPAIGERVAQILGPDLLIWRSNFFFKPPGAPETVWHQTNVFKEFVDHPILEPPDSDSLFQITVWIAIDEANLENGCVQLVPGTHKKLAPVVKTDEEVKGNDTYGYDQQGFFGYNLKREVAFDMSQVVSMECKPGEFFIFTQRTMHGSPPNNTDKRRLAINFRVIQNNVKAYHHFVPDGKIEHYGHVFDLTKWGCVLLHGEDRLKLNQMAGRPSR